MKKILTFVGIGLALIIAWFIFVFGVIYIFTEKNVTQVEAKTKTNSVKENSNDKIKETSKIKTTPKPTKKPKIETKIETKKVIDKNTALEIMRKHYKGIATISFNRKENSINIYPLDENFMFAVYQAKKGDAYSLKHWNNIVEDTRKTTGLLEDETLSINILNNLNGKIILSCMNSKIIYNEVK